MESGDAHGILVRRVTAEELQKPHRLAACVDCETTGLDSRTHELIELAIILFAYEPDSGRIIGIADEYVGQREPYRSIPRDATKIHGLTKAKLKGKVLDTARIESIAARATHYISHNASFDKGFAGRYIPPKPWLCSLYGIDWAAHGCERRGLQALLTTHDIQPGDAHRAGSDALALLGLLSLVNDDGVTYLHELIAGPAQSEARYEVERTEPISAARIDERDIALLNRRNTHSALQPQPSSCLLTGFRWAVAILGLAVILSLIGQTGR